MLASIWYIEKIAYFALCLKNVDKSDIEMSNVCEITGKSFMIGNNVSHSKDVPKGGLIRIFSTGSFIFPKKIVGLA